MCETICGVGPLAGPGADEKTPLPQSPARRRMSILVVCPGCRKSFSVSDKFAGKSGPCPNCKTTITVPQKDEEVKIHAPTEFADGGRSVSGKLLTKPIARAQTKLEPVVAAAIAAGALTVLLVAWLGGKFGLFVREGAAGPQANLLPCAIGLLLVSPPLVVAAYTFLRNDELEPYRGRPLYIRAAICGVAYAALWGVYAYVAGSLLTGQLWEWAFAAPAFLVVGALISLACLDLELSSGFFHYAFYVLATSLLGWIAGLGWVWNLSPTPAF
jgi:hypothetical protein